MTQVAATPEGAEPMNPAGKWEAAIPAGFTAADGVALMAIESGLSLQPWQFDYLARFFDRPSGTDARCRTCGHEPHMTGWCTHDSHPACDCNADESDSR